jgi:hypothetical protein
LFARRKEVAETEKQPLNRVIRQVGPPGYIPKWVLPCRLLSTRRTAGIGADLPILRRSTNGENCPLAVIRALAACTFKTRALTDFALFNHLIRAGAAVAGYAGPEAADFPVKLVLGYIGID